MENYPSESMSCNTSLSSGSCGGGGRATPYISNAAAAGLQAKNSGNMNKHGWQEHQQNSFAANDSDRESVSTSQPVISYPESMHGGGASLASAADSRTLVMPPQLWHSAKKQVAKLLDDRLPLAKRQSIISSLTKLFEALENHPNLMQEISSNHECASDTVPPSAPSTLAVPDTRLGISTLGVDFNDRLRIKIQEFNEGLAHLGTKILNLKTKLMLWNHKPSAQQAPSLNEQSVCCNIHRNFRRILQRESRYLRDELYAARATIARLERRSGMEGTESSTSRSITGGSNILPILDPPSKTLDFINISNGSSTPYRGQLMLTSGSPSPPNKGILKKTLPPQVHIYNSESPVTTQSAMAPPCSAPTYQSTSNVWLQPPPPPPGISRTLSNSEMSGHSDSRRSSQTSQSQHSQSSTISYDH